MFQEMDEEQLQFSGIGDHVGESVLIKHVEDSLVEGNHLQQSQRVLNAALGNLENLETSDDQRVTPRNQRRRKRC